MDFGIAFDVFVDIFSVHAHNLIKPSQSIVVTMNLKDFTVLKKMTFYNCHEFCSLPVRALNFEEFGHRFWFHFGTLA